MRKIVIIVLFIIAAFTASAQEQRDSCYVYTQLHWRPSGFKGYCAQIQMGDEYRFVDIVDENGKGLSFYDIFHALNYMSTQGWELVEMSPKNPDNNHNTLERLAIIRKKMSIEEARKYSTPKE